WGGGGGAPLSNLVRRGFKGRRCPEYGLVVILARQRGSLFMRGLPTLVCYLLDVVARPYDGIDHVVMDDVHETMFDPGNSDDPLVAMGIVAQTPCDMIANLN